MYKYRSQGELLIAEIVSLDLLLLMTVCNLVMLSLFFVSRCAPFLVSFNHKFISLSDSKIIPASLQIENAPVHSYLIKILECKETALYLLSNLDFDPCIFAN